MGGKVCGGGGEFRGEEEGKREAQQQRKTLR